MTVTWLEDDTFFFFGGRLMMVACHDCIRFGTHVGTRRDESVRMVEGLLNPSFGANCCVL